MVPRLTLLGLLLLAAPVAATLTPSLTAPIPSGFYKSPIPMSYTLPEAPLSGSVTLTFSNLSGSIVFSLPDSQSGSYSWNPHTDPASSIGVPASATSLADGVYTVTLQYQNSGGSPAASATANGVTIDTVTQAPALNAPVAQSTVTTSIPIDYALPESPQPNSVQLLFNGTNGHVTLNLDDSTSASLSWNPQTDASQLAHVISTSPAHATLPDGTYDVVLSYQDVLGNTAAIAFASGVIVATQVTTTTTSSTTTTSTTTATTSTTTTTSATTTTSTTTTTTDTTATSTTTTIATTSTDTTPTTTSPTTSSTTISSVTSSTSTSTSSTSAPTSSTATTSTTLPAACTAGAAVVDAVLRITHLDGTAGNEKLLFKGRLGFASGDARAALRPASAGAQILIRETVTPAAILALTAAQDDPIPAGGPGSGCGPQDGWSGSRYANRSGFVDPPTCVRSAHGLRVLRLRDKRAHGRGIAFTVKTAKTTLIDHPPTASIEATIALGGTGTDLLQGACGVAVFAPGDCALDGHTLVCRAVASLRRR